MSKIKESTGNLVSTWMGVEQRIHGRNLNEAIRVLNDSLDAAYTPSRVYQWSRVTHDGRGSQLPRTLRLYMGNVVIFHVLETAGVRPTTLDKLNLRQVVEMLH